VENATLTSVAMMAVYRGQIAGEGSPHLSFAPQIHQFHLREQLSPPMPAGKILKGSWHCKPTIFHFSIPSDYQPQSCYATAPHAPSSPILWEHITSHTLCHLWSGTPNPSYTFLMKEILGG